MQKEAWSMYQKNKKQVTKARLFLKFVAPTLKINHQHSKKP